MLSPTTQHPFKQSGALESEENDKLDHFNRELAYSFIADQWRLGPHRFHCLTSAAMTFENARQVEPEIFTAMLVSDLLRKLPLDTEIENRLLDQIRSKMTESGLFYFFEDHAILPADVDCASVGLAILARAGRISPAVLTTGLDRILANTNRDGIIEVYIDPSADRRGILDPVVCANALYLATMRDRDREAAKTNDYVYRMLEEQSCAQGTRYYPSEDTFLCRIARLVKDYPVRFARFREPLQRRLTRRMGTTSSPLEMAQRIIAASRLDLPVATEKQRLAMLQTADGSWPADGYFRYGRSRIFFGSKALTTAFALRALDTSTDT